MYKLDINKLSHSPRGVRFWECCLGVIFENLSSFASNHKANGNENLIVNINGMSNSGNSIYYLDQAFQYYFQANKNHIPDYELQSFDESKNNFYKRNIKYQCAVDSNIPLAKQEFFIESHDKITKPRIAVVNTKISNENIIKSIRNTPNLKGRFNTLYKIFNQTKVEKADMLLLPECFVPIELLKTITKFSVSEQIVVVVGLEHITLSGVCFNFIVTIIPFEKDGIKDAFIVYRLKNHYAPAESLQIKTNHLIVPQPSQYVYDLFIWKGIYFTTYYCFELASISHRSIFKGQIDLFIACEYNSDTTYFSNIVESVSRDLHVYVAQVNSSQFGDTRIAQPSRTEKMDILKFKGGENDTILVGEIDLNALREFQRKLYITTKDDKEFKPLPPDYQLEYVLKRIQNKPML